MLRKTITYKNFDDETVTEEFHFNLTKAELAEMELGHKGGMQKYLEDIIASEDGAKIIASFKAILTASVGKKSEDGKRFVKNQDIIDEFLESGAYSEFFMELVTNAEAGAKFIKAIVPSDLSTKVPHPMAMPKKEIRKASDSPAVETVDMLSREDFEDHGLEKQAALPVADEPDLTLLSRAQLIEKLLGVQLRTNRTHP